MFRHQASLKADVVFSETDKALQIMRRRPSQNEALGCDLEKKTLSNTKDIQNEARADSAIEQHSFYFISQNTTWSHLNVSMKTFYSIADKHGFSDNIYDVVQAFHRRVSSTEQFRWSACRIRLNCLEKDRYEICYRMQYPVRNHRHRGDPFSMRQIGVCERSNGPQDCAWIVLQPSQEILSLLEAKISSADYFSTHAKDPISLHLVFHDFQTSKWDDYVEHLRTTLEALIEAAHFTRFSRGCKYPHSDYRLEFDGCQRLQRFQWKLAQLLPAIEGNIAVTRTFEEQWSEKARSASVQASLTNARGFVKQLDFHRESVRKLVEQAQCCSEFLHRILDYKNSNRMQSINAAMCHTLGTLDTQANILASYGEQKAKDSKSIRALTTVATLYLPASLVATIFSSSIVQLLPTMPPRQPSHFVAAPQTWLPVTATLSLMAVTLISVYILERVYRYFK